MANSPQGDEYKEKFRPNSDPALDKEIEAALGDVSMDQLLGFNQPQGATDAAQQPAAGGGGGGQPAEGGVRKGKVIQIGRDDVFIDLGGKSQGVVPLLQFNEIKIGDEFEFLVERYDPR